MISNGAHAPKTLNLFWKDPTSNMLELDFKEFIVLLLVSISFAPVGLKYSARCPISFAAYPIPTRMPRYPISWLK